MSILTNLLRLPPSTSGTSRDEEQPSSGERHQLVGNGVHRFSTHVFIVLIVFLCSLVIYTRILGAALCQVSTSNNWDASIFGLTWHVVGNALLEDVSLSSTIARIAICRNLCILDAQGKLSHTLRVSHCQPRTVLTPHKRISCVERMYVCFQLA